MIKRIVLLLSLFVSVNGVAANAPLKPADFAFGMPIKVNGSDGIYRLTLPAAVYQIIQHNDLRDLRVFNADGEVVPHVVTRASGSVSVSENPIELPRFPVSAPGDAKLGDVDLQVRRSADGTVVNVKSRDTNPIKPKLIGYVLDASKVAPAIKALELDWEDAATNYVGAVTLEASDDLKTWQVLVRDAPLAHMAFAGNRLEQRRIEFSSATVIYLRLSWPNPQAGEGALPPIKRVTAILADRVSDTARVWSDVSAKPSAEKPGEYEFDVGGRLPVDRLRIDLPQVNTLAQAELLARDQTATPWQPVKSLTAYRVAQNGRVLNTPEVSLERHPNRYWLLRVAQTGGGLGQGTPVLHVGWLPDQLLFVARGRAPFQLAYGARGVASGEVPITTLLDKNANNGAIDARPAVLGEPIALAGAASLGPVVESFPWKKILLWGMLGLGVVLLGFMAYRLMGQLQQPGNQDSSTLK